MPGMPERFDTLEGPLRKLSFAQGKPIRYVLHAGGDLPLNPCLGQGLRVTWLGETRCEHCGTRTAKRYGGGYCYRCFKALARCDLCVVSPTRCHHHLGTCREPDWGETHCMVPHTVYLANSSGVKVGLTRGTTGVPRWIEQGAIQGLSIARAETRRAAGELEALLAERIPDKTDWRALVTGGARRADLAAVADGLPGRVRERAGQLSGVGWLEDREAVELEYPIERYSRRPARLTLAEGADRIVEGRLRGVIGQFLLFDHGAFHVAGHAGCTVRVETLGEAVAEPQMELF